MDAVQKTQNLDLPVAAKKEILWGRVAGRVAIYILMALIAFGMMFPFYMAVVMSFIPNAMVFTYPPIVFPYPATFENYVQLVQSLNFFRLFWNSTYITMVVLVGQLLFCSMAGYAFARIQFPGSRIAFALVLASMMIPAAVNIIPLYVMYRIIGWINTYWTLTIPHMLTGSFGVFLMRQFFMTLPMELEEAARMDGATSFAIYSRIMIPLAKPVLAALAIFTFMNTWNDFFNPLIFINSRDKMTLILGLASLKGENTTNWALLMAGATLSVMPILLIYVFAQKQFIQGIAITGMKM